jgi:uncharacterized membrane-anchored protein
MPQSVSRPTLKHEMLMKVPEITLIFWIAKLATTAFGEAFSDFIFFNDYIGRNLAILMGLAFLIICLAIQFRTRRYVPWIYWLAVTAVSIFGTMSADFLNKDLGMPLYASTLMLLGFQAAVFIAWYVSQKTLDVHSINTHLRDCSTGSPLFSPSPWARPQAISPPVRSD